MNYEQYSTYNITPMSIRVTNANPNQTIPRVIPNQIE